MKAAVLKNLNSELTISEVELTPLKVGQVLVEVLVSGICGSQLQEISGYKGNEKFLPHLLGHEGCGKVLETGPGVTTVKVGDKVVMHWRTGSGIESEFPEYILGGKKISSGKINTLSEFAIVSENRVTTVPHETPDYLCALLGCGLSTALGIVNNEIELKFGESILIIGCGGVGLNLIQAANLGSAFPIFVIDRNDSKRKLAISLGANYFINSLSENLDELIKKHALSGKIDIIIDTSGDPKTINEMSTYLSDNGRLILVGQPKPDTQIMFSSASKLFGTKGKYIKTTQGGKSQPELDIPRFIGLYLAGKINFDKVITDVFSLIEVNKALSLLRSGTAGRIMIDMKRDYLEKN